MFSTLTKKSLYIFVPLNSYTLSQDKCAKVASPMTLHNPKANRFMYFIDFNLSLHAKVVLELGSML